MRIIVSVGEKNEHIFLQQQLKDFCIFHILNSPPTHFLIINNQEFSVTFCKVIWLYLGLKRAYLLFLKESFNLLTQ